MYIGIDCGTQGTKAIVLDSVQKKVIGVGYAKHELMPNTIQWSIKMCNNEIGGLRHYNKHYKLHLKKQKIHRTFHLI